MKVLKAYKFRLYPTNEQKQFIHETFRCVGLVHNLLLADRIKQYREFKENPQHKQKRPTPAQYKDAYPELKKVDSLALANAQMHLDHAFKLFFKEAKSGFPKKKSPHAVRSYTTNNQNGTVRLLDDQHLKVPKLKTPLKMKVHQPIQGTIKSATLSITASHKYFVSLLCEEEVTPLTKTQQAVGLIVDKQGTAILSTGERLQPDVALIKTEQRLKRERRKLNRRKKIAQRAQRELAKQSNYQKQKLLVCKLNERLNNQRIDFVNKITKYLVTNYDIICLTENELNLPPEKAVIWHAFFTKLDYKAQWYGKKVIRVQATGAAQCPPAIEATPFRVTYEQPRNLAKAPHIWPSMHVLLNGLQLL